MTAPVALSLEAVRVCYGGAVAVAGVTLAVGRGEVVGLLGPNGSGKSSLIAVAAGVLTPSAGAAWVDGVRRDADPAGYAARVGLVPQESALYDELTAAENLNFFGELYGLGGADLRRRVARVLARFRLTDRARARVGTLSGGMRQRLNLAAALLHDPPVLLLDEPTAALDPASRDALLADLTRLKEDGHAVLLSTHHLDEAELGCDRVAVLDRGTLVAAGTPAELLRARPADRPALYGHLRARPPKFVVRAARGRLPAGVELEITGRRVRLAAPDHEGLGRALGLLLAEGFELETFRTPGGSLERVLRGEPAVSEPTGAGA